MILEKAVETHRAIEATKHMWTENILHALWLYYYWEPERLSKNAEGNGNLYLKQLLATREVE